MKLGDLGQKIFEMLDPIRVPVAMHALLSAGTIDHASIVHAGHYWLLDYLADRECIIITLIRISGIETMGF